MAGYNEMLRRIDPEKIICYNTPFPEMQGNIIYVDYERSSWRYMSYERGFRSEDLDAFKIGSTLSGNYDTITPYLIGKGGGSAYGGRWKPSKPEDYRLLGQPGEIKTTFDKRGNRIETKIGNDGRAIAERHYTITTCPNFTVTHTIITSTGKHHDTGYQTLKSRTSITGRMRIQMERQNLRCLEVYT